MIQKDIVINNFRDLTIAVREKYLCGEDKHRYLTECIIINDSEMQITLTNGSTWRLRETPGDVIGTCFGIDLGLEALASKYNLYWCMDVDAMQNLTNIVEFCTKFNYKKKDKNNG